MIEDILESAGLFLDKNYIDSQTCQALIKDLKLAKLADGKVINYSHGHKTTNYKTGIVDKSIRSVSSATIDDHWYDLVENRMMDYMGSLSEHYNLKLNSFEGPEFLVYREGDFFEPHCDNGGVFAERAVTAVVHLNNPTCEAFPYQGGLLSLFAKTVEEKKVIHLPVIVDPGVLVTFRSDIIHGVSRVTRGVRYAIVGWYRF